MIRTVSDLLADVPEGQSRTFEASISEATREPYVQVNFNHDHGPPVVWSNRPAFEELPWMGSRTKARIGIAQLAEPNLSYEEHPSKLVDFYSTGTSAFVISERLRSLIEEVDPGSLEARQVFINAGRSRLAYCFVMPARNLNAVETSRTTVKIEDTKYHTQWIRSVRFPEGVWFDEEKLRNIYQFSDIDVLNVWIWSQELVDRAKNEGIKGLYTCRPGTVAGSIDYL